ncbi:MAG: ABC transporter permease [Saprospiraceae bacterium]|nr:MAG: ABC transporter permease [Saprospiraceae bacterium]
MLFSYLKVALRNISKQKFYSFINILGLAIGLAICLLIMLFIKDELSYDKHHSKADRIYRALMVWGKQHGEGQQSPIGPYRLLPALQTDFPELEQVARIVSASGTLVTYENVDYQEDRMFFADPAIFDIFDYELIQGDKKTALLEPATMILSESTAKKYFGQENPMGKSLIVDGDNNIKVTGVFKDFPNNTHLSSDIFISMETGKGVFNQLVLNNWGEGSSYTYMLLPENVSAEHIAARMPAFIEKNMGEGSSEGVAIELQKMTDIHLHSNLPGEIQANSDIRYIYISSAIALFILLLASINYMNLATARSIKRAMEIGVRKTLGAPRSALIGQFLSESVVIASFGLMAGFFLALFALSAFNSFMDKELTLNLLENPDILLFFVGITLLLGLISGSYPAFYLSSFQAIGAIKENFSQGGSGFLRKFLVVFQFAISVILIFATVVVFTQWDFLRHKDLGMNQENLIMVPIPDLDQYQAVKTQLQANPNILSVGASNKILTGRLSSNLGFKAEQYEPDPNGRNSIKIVTTDHDFLKTLEVQFVAGRNFSREFVSDDTSAFILNQAAVDLIGWEEPIGKWFETNEFNDGTWVPRTGKVIGVVKNYNHESLYNDVQPVVYYVSKTWLNWMTLRLSGNDVSGTLADVKAKWVQFAPEELYDFSFLDDRIDEMYRTEQRFFSIFTFFTFLAIFIAGMGILGLSAFMAEQRTKEIGVRRVFGASTGHLVFLLTKEFSKLLVIGFVISAPIAYWLLEDWLQDFTYRIQIGWVPFAVAALVAMVMTFLTSGFQSLRAAMGSPVEALKYE